MNENELKDEMLKLDNQLCFAIYACSKEIIKGYRPFLDNLGLTYTQYITLLALWEKDGVTVKELGNRLYLDSGTLTPLLKKLEASNLIVRIRDKEDERNVIIKLTEEGRNKKLSAECIPYKLLENTKLSPEKLESIRESMKALLESMK
ncbi:MarR family winged helix-turn-helix transcriptional regulator [Clostridium manihotivorum]|uniref:MarR family transcriptional regulator n=1 Tax=Clostridium manihotivorum TaxID=2320868 RepID=A0A410DPS7_9CLOT|nr:MarR family transcriptional regulator [Clostridium manihotivorum]QAA31058.1 MarR family transcriptional regulator [Clostridium manihotivorum]